MKRYIKAGKQEFPESYGDGLDGYSLQAKKRLIRWIRRDFPEYYNRELLSKSPKELSELFENLSQSSSSNDYSDVDWPGKDVEQFVKSYKDEVISYLNDTTDLWGDEFVDACIDAMLEKLDEANINYPDDIELYLADVFEGYGQY